MRARLPALIDSYEADRVKNCAYELSLGTQVFVTGDDRTRREVALGEQISIPPGQFANLLTKETVSVPDDALGLISMRFTLKQPGLVNVSGFHVDPGYKGKLLFSVYNAGPQAVPITSGRPAFLLWYCSLDTATTDLYVKPPRIEITDKDVKHLGGEVFSPQSLGPRLQRLEVQVGIAKWFLGTVVAAIIGALIVLGVSRALEDDSRGSGGNQSPAPPTTAATAAPLTTAVPPTGSLGTTAP